MRVSSRRKYSIFKNPFPNHSIPVLHIFYYKSMIWKIPNSYSVKSISIQVNTFAFKQCLKFPPLHNFPKFDCYIIFYMSMI